MRQSLSPSDKKSPQNKQYKRHWGTWYVDRLSRILTIQQKFNFNVMGIGLECLTEFKLEAQ